MRVAVLFERFGPYHCRRIEAAAELIDITAIEIYRRDETYAWSQTSIVDGIPFERVADDNSTPYREVEVRLRNILDRCAPEVVAVPGWYAAFSHTAIRWAHKNGVRVVVMSDSNHYDARRNAISERFKSAVLSHVSAGFVAGRDSRDYLVKLGMDPKRTVLGYNVVDNEHFDRRDLVSTSERSSFLAVGRFVPRKNFLRLIEAYGQYVQACETEPWPLVIAGDGDQREELEAEVVRLGLSSRVTFTGFAEYSTLPDIYAKAAAFILPSLVEQWGLVINEAMAAGCAVLLSASCGASRDLLLPGFNGYEFDPTDTNALSRYMNLLSSEPAMTRGMGAASRKIISGYSIESFGVSLTDAATLALSARSPRPSRLDKFLFSSVERRSRMRAQ